VLVGGSSTGKTRACWEALRLLRDRKPGWRLWHPIDPSRPEAVLRDLSSIGPRTVVWLNEAQFYLDVTADDLGEQVAPGLRELLRDPGRGPVLVLATLWPELWHFLTVRPPVGKPDLHAQARELLAGRDITVPAAFTPAKLKDLIEAWDPRLTKAAAASHDGQVVQFLAGAPELVARYRNAPPAAAALISAAIDARRMGMGIALPLAFLELAAPGYLTEDEWDRLGVDWLEQALAYTAASCKGTRGPLSRIRPKYATRPVSEMAYRLADYLDEYGRRVRSRHIPPTAFWAAAASLANPGDLVGLAAAAEDRGLLCDAARLLKRAAAQGHTSAAITLFQRLHSLHSADQAPARWVSAHADLDRPADVAHLLSVLQEAGAHEQVGVLASRAVAHADVSDPSAVAELLEALRMAAATEQVAALIVRDPAGQANLSDPSAVGRLLKALGTADADQQVGVLASRAVAHADVSDPSAVAELLEALRMAAATEQVAALIVRDPAGQANLSDPSAVAELLEALRMAAATEQVAALIVRDPAGQANLSDPTAAARLLKALRMAAATEQVAALIARDPAAHADLDEGPTAAARLLHALQNAGADEQAAALVGRLSAEGLFRVFYGLNDHQTRFKFGREPDGSPAQSWGWDDLN